MRWDRSHGSVVSGHGSRVMGQWSVVISRWSWVSGQWSLVIRHWSWVVCAVLLAGPSLAGDKAPDKADRVVSAVVEVKADIERDTQELNELRAQIAEQRSPLANRLEALQKTVGVQRETVERIRHLRKQSEQEQVLLETEILSVDEECQFLLALFTEYTRSMETRIGVAEAERLGQRLRPIKTELGKGSSFEGLADTIGRLMDLSSELVAERMGGVLFDGAALDADGIEHFGRFAVMGPAAYFASSDSDIAGLAITQFGETQPGIYDHFDGKTMAAIRALTEGQAVKVPVDVTEGDAVKVEAARPTFLQHLKKGGVVMVPLMVVAVVAVLLAVWKAIELSHVRVESGTEVAETMAALKRGDIQSAKTLATQLRPPLRSLAEEAIEHRDSPRDHLEELMHEHVLALLPWMERNLGTLAVLGGIAPLLGLLGTVTGMIHTFQLVTVFGSGDAKLLSGGISEALVTTETGLAIAIPVLLAHAFLARRARGIIGALERMAVAMVNSIKMRDDNV